MLAKSKLNSIEVVISKTLIDSVNYHDEFVLTNNVLIKYDKIKEKIKNLKSWTVDQRSSLFKNNVMI